MTLFGRMVAVLGVIMLLAVGCADRGNDSSSQAAAGAPTAQLSQPGEHGLSEDGPVLPADPAGHVLAPGDYTFELEHGGRTRSYIVHVPATPIIPAPIIVALHGGGGTGQAFQEQNGLDRVAEREGFVTVYPEGTGILPNRLHTWNSGKSCCGFAFDRGIDDVGFLRKVITDLTSRIDLDIGRVYMTGHSNGAMMAYRFATETPNMVTAIVAVGGAPDLDLVAATQPVAVLHIHSLDDPRALYEGGEGPPFPGTD